MPTRNRSARALDQFQLALDEGCSMAEAADRLRQREEAERIAAARALHAEGLARLRAKGWRG